MGSIVESGGQALSIGAISDGQTLARSGTAIVGSSASGTDPNPFNIGVLLDLSADPDDGIAPNIGVYGDSFDFEVEGSFSRSAIGSTYYWESTATGSRLMLKPLHDYRCASATFSSANLNNGSANIVITDTAHDLKALYEWMPPITADAPTNPRRFKIDLSCQGANPYYLSGYLGACTKSGNDYTFDVYQTAHSTTKSWHKAGIGAWAATDVRWFIYPRTFELDSPYHGDTTISLWYYCADATADYTVLAGKWAWWNNGDDIGTQYVFSHQATNYALQYAFGSTVQQTGAVNVLPTNKWIFAAVHQGYGINMSAMINGDTLNFGQSGQSTRTEPAFGLFSFFGSSWRQGDNTGSVNGSRIAFPCFDKGYRTPAELHARYHQQRILMGLGLEH